MQIWPFWPDGLWAALTCYTVNILLREHHALGMKVWPLLSSQQWSSWLDPEVNTERPEKAIWLETDWVLEDAGPELQMHIWGVMMIAHFLRRKDSFAEDALNSAMRPTDPEIQKIQTNQQQKHLKKATQTWLESGVVTFGLLSFYFFATWGWPPVITLGHSFWSPWDLGSFGPVEPNASHKLRSSSR